MRGTQSCMGAGGCRRIQRGAGRGMNGEHTEYAGWLQRSWGCKFSGCVGRNEGPSKCRGEGRHSRDLEEQERCKGIGGCRRGTWGVQGECGGVGGTWGHGGAGGDAGWTRCNGRCGVLGACRQGCRPAAHGEEFLTGRMGRFGGAGRECRPGGSTREDGGDGG